MQLFPQIWDYISSRGVTALGEEERPLIEMYNRMSFVSAVITFFISISSLLFGFPEYAIITFGISLFYTLIILLNHLGHIYTVRFIGAILSPLWICLVQILVAGNFNQGMLILAVLAITYVSFDRQPFYRSSLITFTVLCYLGSLVFTNVHGPILGVINLPYDEFLVFLISSSWLGKILITFIKDRENLIVNLQNNNTKLKQTTEELERFTYIASHDLKSPLRTINSFIGLIERDIRRKNFDNLPERMRFVKSGAQQMNTLVEDILEISTLNNPEQRKRKKVDLNEVLAKVQVNLTDDINSKNAVVVAETLPSFYCDEAEFLLLFQNMIQNGIKYNESEQPIINISTEKTKNQLLISFKDNGIGIEDEYHEQIFQFFKRLHTCEKYQGTGLGLGLCKKIVNSYGGKIEVDSVTGEGSTFRIKLEMEAKSN